jgi:phosphatidylglycerophosphatase C
MNVYDFDETIYKGDSTRDFIVFCYRRHFFKMLTFAPGHLWTGFLYFLDRIDKTEMKQRLYKMFIAIDDMDAEIQAFWKTHLKKIKPWYKENQKPDDVVISASPEFLLQPAMDLLGIEYMMASVVDKETGVYFGVNCHGVEKVLRYSQVFGDAPIDRFYSDSLSDTPLARLAKESFIVRGETLTPWEDYKRGWMKEHFFNRQFFSFAFAFFFASVAMLLLSVILGSFLPNGLAFSLAAIGSMILNFVMNSRLVFHMPLSLGRFLKFLACCVPGFLLLSLFEWWFVRYNGWAVGWAYLAAVLVGAPLTFLLLKQLAFQDKD